MKKRFLSIMLTAALAFGGTIATPVTATVTTEAATVPDTMPNDVKTLLKSMSDAELADILDMARERVGDVNYEKNDTRDAAMLRDDCTFLTGAEAVNSYSSNGGWILWLNQAEEEILRQRYPEIFANIPSPICLDAGYDGEDYYMNEHQVKPSETSEFGIAPDFGKIIGILNRGPYTINLTGSIATNCAGTVKVGKAYKVTASYQLTASDGGDFSVNYAMLELSYNRKKPTKITASFTSNNMDQTLERTFTLKMSKSLQKQIKAGKVKLAGANLYVQDNDSVISTYKNSPSKSGKINLSFKFKAAK